MGNSVDDFVDCTKLLSPGVYALTWRRNVVYVGKSKCMLLRIHQHYNLRSRPTQNKILPWVLPNARGMKFDGIFVYPCRIDEVDELEVRMIKKYNPKFNTQHKVRVGVPLTVVIRGKTFHLNKPKPEIISSSVEPMIRRKLAC